MCEQRQPVFCGTKIQTWIPKGFDYKEITVKCGNTSPSGDPYECDECHEKNAGISWRKLAQENGELFEEEEY